MGTGPAQLPSACARCGATPIESEWSEAADAHKTVHIWRCTVCGHKFETKDDVVEPELTETELAEEFLPNLVVS